MSAPPRRTQRDVAAQLARRYGAAPRSTLRFGALPTTRTVRPMGPLVELHVRRFADDVVEVWPFSPRPRLVFNAANKRLWVMGGGFAIDGEGFHARRGELGLSFEPIERARTDAALHYQLREFRRTHNDLDPIEAFVGEVRLPPRDGVVALGWMEQAVYKTDRRDGDGRSEWYHPFEDEHLPGVLRHTQAMVCTDRTGTGLWFAGGTYSVIDGWLAG